MTKKYQNWTWKFMNPCNEECDLVDDELKSIASSFSNLTSSINGDSQMLIMLWQKFLEFWIHLYECFTSKVRNDSFKV